MAVDQHASEALQLARAGKWRESMRSVVAALDDGPNDADRTALEAAYQALIVAASSLEYDPHDVLDVEVALAKVEGVTR